MRSACLFWPGSEAEIQGKRPSYYLHFDDKLDDEKRVDKVVAWLKLPPELRPHFITLYYANVDHAGHAYDLTLTKCGRLSITLTPWSAIFRRNLLFCIFR